MSQDLFGRVVKLRVYATVTGQDSSTPPNPVISYDGGYTEFSSVQPNGDPGFRIVGKVIQVQNTTTFSSNPAYIQIYNLGKDSRALFESKIGTRLDIFAGYNSDVKQLALTNILWARTHKAADASYVTEIIAGDSHYGQTNSDISISLKGQTTYQQAVNAIFGQLALVNIFPGTQDIPAGGWNNGIVVGPGSCLPELAKICDKMGRVMTVFGGHVNIVKPGADLGGPVIVISTDTGLVGIPEVQPPGVIGYVPPVGYGVSPSQDVSFTHLLRAELSMQQSVFIKSKFVAGEYTILRSEFDFDSWSGPFYVHCQCTKRQAAASGQ